MCSRYTAYTLADANYLKKTWDPQNCPPLNPTELKQVHWAGLKIIAKEKGEESDDAGIVEFIAYNFASFYCLSFYFWSILYH